MRFVHPLRSESGEKLPIQHGDFQYCSPMPMAAARTWAVYGLHVNSNYPLPFPPVPPTKTDLIVRYDGLMPRPTCAPPAIPTTLWKQERDRWVLRYHNSHGDALEFRFACDGTFFSIQQSYHEWWNTLLILLGPALGAVLHLRGIPLVHASSVAIDDAAALLVGMSGLGKSTLTATLAAEGMPFLCDDLAALHIEDGRVFVQPAYPLLKVSPHFSGFLGRSEDDLPHVFTSVPRYEERWVDVNTLSGGFRDTPAPLRTIYILAGQRADLLAPQIVPLSPAVGCLALTEHLYGQTWLNIARDAALRVCARIARAAPVRQVWLPEGLDTVRSSARTLIADALSLPLPALVVD
jgi:hypothetical protein